MPSQRVGGWAGPSGSSELVSPGRQRRHGELGAGRTARGSKRGVRRPDRRRYLELHFLIHLQQRGHGRAGPCPLRWRPEALWAPGRGSEGREETRLLSDAAALAGSLTARSLARSLPPSLGAACPPARLLPAACCLLTLSLALPAFAAHAGRYVTANRRDSGEDAHVPCAAVLRFGSGRSIPAHISRVPVPGKRQVRGWVAESCLQELSLKKTRELFDSR